jgi:polyisoprenoid-binding protein YceI
MTTTIQQVPTDTYGLDPVHSSFGFGVRYNGLATFRSSFDKVDAQLADGVLTGSADVRSIVIDEPRFKDHVLAADFFDVENTPTITFRSTDIRPAEDGSVEVDGELTIRGVTKAVTATGTYATGGDAFGNDRVAFEVQTTVDRREFGLDWQMVKPDGSEALAYDVTISAELQLVKQA